MPSPITRSPLKVVMAEHGMRMTATDPDGNVVLEGERVLIAAPDPDARSAVQTTATGAWSIGRRMHGETPVYDAAGVPVAVIRRSGGFGKDTIVTGDGTEIAVGSARLRPWFGASFGSFGRARAAPLRQSHSFKLKLSDELLARPDHEMLTAVFAHVARQKISSQISAAQSSSSP